MEGNRCVHVFQPDPVTVTVLTVPSTTLGESVTLGPVPSEKVLYAYGEPLGVPHGDNVGAWSRSIIHVEVGDNGSIRRLRA